MRVVAVFALVCVAFAAAQKFPYTSCGTNADHFHLKSLNIVPYPPTRGSTATITMNGTLDETVTAGKLHLTLEYYEVWWHNVLDQTYDACSVDPTVHCPVSSGVYNLGLTQQIPTQVNGETVPAGQYKGTIQLADQSNAEISCVNFQIQLN